MINRRNLLAAASAAVTLAATASTAAAADHDHDHHHGPATANAKIAATALDCVRTGDACLAHCLDSFIANDTTLAVCAKKVNELISACATLAKLAANGSPHLAAYAKTATAICKDCEKECRKHADKHATCKACADSCAACAEECSKLG
ncbi:Ferredoxin [Paramagnetospirillum magnetotacticum MS-1]|uniref:Ferredoxin n=1 Tax=Paramagnetospirillum magnetotacticum MS-1 TaxID=272627 RepID=A0A0C2UEZ1_PARME|nr:Csp1 family four helix bundle copper storage protein [Paramagnetospirillum magnetotacticum]KIM00068.1 Ferredoxin [Paramagnetospirillum magnetotacticum MS-1]